MEKWRIIDFIMVSKCLKCKYMEEKRNMAGVKLYCNLIFKEIWNSNSTSAIKTPYNCPIYMEDCKEYVEPLNERMDKLESKLNRIDNDFERLVCIVNGWIKFNKYSKR